MNLPSCATKVLQEAVPGWLTTEPSTKQEGRLALRLDRKMPPNQVRPETLPPSARAGLNTSCLGTWLEEVPQQHPVWFCERAHTICSTELAFL